MRGRAHAEGARACWGRVHAGQSCRRVWWRACARTLACRRRACGRGLAHADANRIAPACVGETANGFAHAHVWQGVRMYNLKLKGTSDISETAEVEEI
jgi:hypothetical protein